MIANEIANVNDSQLSVLEKSLYNVVRAAVKDELKTVAGPVNASEYVDVNEAMELLGVKRTKLYQLTTQGAFSSYRVGRELRYKRSELLEYVEQAFQV